MAEEGPKGARQRQRARVGTVASAGGQKTIHVIVDNLVEHPMYGKYVRRRTKVAAHDPGNVAGVGDVVEIMPCRRLSKTKSWRLVRVVRRSAAVRVAGPETGGAGQEE